MRKIQDAHLKMLVSHISEMMHAILEKPKYYRSVRPQKLVFVHMCPLYLSLIKMLFSLAAYYCVKTLLCHVL